jgi:hypothetical protein
MFKNVEDLANYTDEQLWAVVRDGGDIYGSEEENSAYVAARNIVRNYESVQQDIAYEIYERIKNYDPEREDENEDTVYDYLMDFMPNYAKSEYKWDYEYKQYWIPSNC